MTTTSNDIDYLLAENARLQAELAQAAEAARNASKAADKARAELTELKMTANAPSGTDHPPAIAESVIKKLPPEVVDALRELLGRTDA